MFTFLTLARRRSGAVQRLLDLAPCSILQGIYPTSYRSTAQQSLGPENSLDDLPPPLLLPASEAISSSISARDRRRLDLLASNHSARQAKQSMTLKAMVRFQMTAYQR